MPIVLIVILGLALSGIFDAGTVSIGQIHIAVVDEVSETEIAGANAQLGTNMGGSYDEMSLYTVLDSDEIQDFLSYSVVDADKADSLLEDGEVDAIVTIPAGYAQGLADAMYGSGESVSIDVLYEDPSLETTVAEGIVQSYADTLSSISADIGVLYQAVEQGASIQAMATLDVASYIQTAVSASIADTVEITSQGIEARPVINSYYYYSIAITCMFILYAAGQGSTFLYTESEDRTLQRLSAAGVPDTKLLLGKSFAVFCPLYTSADCTVWIFNVDIRDQLGEYADICSHCGVRFAFGHRAWYAADGHGVPGGQSPDRRRVPGRICARVCAVRRKLCTIVRTSQIFLNGIIHHTQWACDQSIY